MKNNFDPVDELRTYLTKQLEAHLKNDWDTYDQLEQEIQRVEKRL